MTHKCPEIHNTAFHFSKKNRSTGNERHQLLQSILRAEEDNEEEEDEAPDDEVSRQLFYISN